MADKSNLAAKVSPKVSSAGAWAAIAGLLLTVLTGVVNGLDPHLFDFLGPWGGVVYTAVIGAAAVAGGYLKPDPLRDVGAVAQTPPLPAPAPLHPVTAEPIVPAISEKVAQEAAAAGGTFGGTEPEETA